MPQQWWVDWDRRDPENPIQATNRWLVATNDNLSKMFVERAQLQRLHYVWYSINNSQQLTSCVVTN